MGDRPGVQHGDRGQTVGLCARVAAASTLPARRVSDERHPRPCPCPHRSKRSTWCPLAWSRAGASWWRASHRWGAAARSPRGGGGRLPSAPARIRACAALWRAATALTRAHAAAGAAADRRCAPACATRRACQTGRPATGRPPWSGPRGGARKCERRGGPHAAGARALPAVRRACGRGTCAAWRAAPPPPTPPHTHMHPLTCTTAPPLPPAPPAAPRHRPAWC